MRRNGCQFAPRAWVSGDFNGWRVESMSAPTHVGAGGWDKSTVLSGSGNSTASRGKVETVEALA